MIRAVLSSTKPVAAAARPVHAFSSEMTTGMSAPPIGSTNRLPSRNPPTSNSASQTPLSVVAVSTTSAPSASPRPALMRFCPGNTMG